MSSLALLGALLAAGWYFYRQWHFTRFEALSKPGHPQYFGAALCATYLFAVAAPVHYLLDSSLIIYQESINIGFELFPAVADENGKEQLRKHYAITGLSLILAAFLPTLLNKPLKYNGRLRQVIALRNGAIDRLEHLAIHCIDFNLSCALTTTTGKVYVGTLDWSRTH